MYGRRPGIVGVGYALPGRVVTNEEINRLTGAQASDEIQKLTGINERRFLGEDEDPVALAATAARQALDHAGLVPSDIQLLIAATSIPYQLVPGTAPFLAQALGLIPGIPFFDLNAACSGFVYALPVAQALMNSSGYERVLVVCEEGISRFLDPRDRDTFFLFADGAGAAVLGQVPVPRGIMASHWGGNNEEARLVAIERGGTYAPQIGTEDCTKGRIHMEGSRVFKSAVRMLAQSLSAALERAGLTQDQLDWIIPHQANLRIIEALVHRLEFPRERVVVNIDHVGNTSAASIPIALAEAVQKGSIQEYDYVALTGFGAGTTYGTVIMRW